MTNEKRKKLSIGIALGAVALTLATFVPSFIFAINSIDWTDIFTEEDLLKVNEDLSGNYRLQNDIYLKDSWTPIGTTEKPFRGLFNGNNCTIYNARIDNQSHLEKADGEYLVGIFGVNEGTVIYLQAVDIDLSWTEWNKHAYCFGQIAAVNKGYVTTCKWWWKHGLFTMKGGSGTFGGFVGRNYGQIKNCYTDAAFFFEDPNGSSSIGLFAGATYDGSLIDWCKAYPQVKVTADPSSSISVSVGGLVGRSFGGTINNCDCRNAINVPASFGENTSIGGAIGSVAEGGTTCFQQSIRAAFVNYNGLAENVFIGGIFGRIENEKCEITVKNAAFMGNYSITEVAYASSCGCGDTGIGVDNFLYAYSPKADKVYHHGTLVQNYDDITIDALHLDGSIWQQKEGSILLR